MNTLKDNIKNNIKKLSKWIFAIGLGFITTSAFAATYEVPVQPELKPYAQFQMAPPVMSREGEHTVIRYSLPPELVGPNHPGITMTGDNYSGDQFQMTSDNGVANCVRTDSVRCDVHFKNLNINAQEVRRYLFQHSKSHQEFQQRSQVALMFGSQPVGILRY